MSINTKKKNKNRIIVSQQTLLKFREKNGYNLINERNRILNDSINSYEKGKDSDINLSELQDEEIKEIVHNYYPKIVTNTTKCEAAIQCCMEDILPFDKATQCNLYHHTEIFDNIEQIHNFVVSNSQKTIQSDSKHIAINVDKNADINIYTEVSTCPNTTDISNLNDAEFHDRLNDIDTPNTTLDEKISSDIDLFHNKANKKTIKKIEKAQILFDGLAEKTKEQLGIGIIDPNLTLSFSSDDDIINPIIDKKYESCLNKKCINKCSCSIFEKHQKSNDKILTDDVTDDSHNLLNNYANNEVKRLIQYMNDKINIVNRTENNKTFYKLTDAKLFARVGGASIKNNWLSRDINKISSPEYDANIKLNKDNTFELKTGSYKIHVSSNFYNTGTTKIRLFEINKKISLMESINKYISIDDNKNDTVDINDYIKIPNNEIYIIALQYYCEFSILDIGLGIPCGFNDCMEIYTIITIDKL